MYDPEDLRMAMLKEGIPLEEYYKQLLRERESLEKAMIASLRILEFTSWWYSVCRRFDRFLQRCTDSYWRELLKSEEEFKAAFPNWKTL